MKVSFVIPCYNSEKTLSAVVLEIQNKMANLLVYTYEILLVNDSSTDNTLEVIRKLCASNTNVIGIDQAKNFGQHSALMAGFRFSTGDIVVCLDDDGQTPANEADKLIEMIINGYDAVYAKYETKKHSFFRNVGSSINNKMAEMMLYKPKDLYVSSYFAIKRFLVDEIIKYENAYPYVIGLVLRSTSNVCNVTVKHRKRNIGESGYSFKKLLSLWMNGFTSFSIKPLRTATFFGAFTACIGFIYAIIAIIRKIVDPTRIIGWSSIISILLFLGGCILLVLGMIGEYIGRTYISINRSPQYVIREIIGKSSKIGLKREGLIDSDE